MPVIPPRKVRTGPVPAARAKVFRAIIKLAQDPTKPYHQIAKELNGLGFSTPRHLPCNESYVERMIKEILKMEKEGTLQKFLREN
jgi:hypothetical protein